MNEFAKAAACAAVLLAASGQAATGGASAPASGPAQVVPLKTPRHLQYSYDASITQSVESHNSGMNGTGSGGTGSGIASSFGNSGEHGTVYADVVALTTNGGLVVQIHDEPRYGGHPTATSTCTVFDDGKLNCTGLTRSADATGTVDGISAYDVLLLDFMGRKFIDPSRLDAQNHWRVAYATASASVVEDFTVTDSGNGKTVSVVGHKRLTPNAQDVAAGTEDLHVTYDTTVSLPDRIHDERIDRWSDGQSSSTVDLVLTSDSFAKG